MEDERYCFVEDVRDKKITARSAKNVRTHNGKGGRVKLPCDYLTSKELKALNGDVKSYRMNDPMKWNEFKEMPDDLKIAYIKVLRGKYNVPDCRIADMLGVSKVTLSHYLKTLGISGGRNSRGKDTKWDDSGWLAWLNRATPPPSAVESVEASFTEDAENGLANLRETVEDEPAPGPMVDAFPVLKEAVTAVPESGSMTFTGLVEAALKAVGVLLGGANAEICISWKVCDRGADNGK